MGRCLLAPPAHDMMIFMEGVDFTRNFGARPGYALHDAVDLPGWEDQSVWGWDEPMGTFHAQLWRNGSRDDRPDFWLSGVDPGLPWPSSVALEVFLRLSVTPLQAVRALAIAAPRPALRGVVGVASVVRDLRGAGDGDYVRGQRAALDWVRGVAEAAPASLMPWKRAAPTPEEVDAEHHLVTACLYRPELASERQFYSGIDEALFWVLGRANELTGITGPA